MTDGDTRKPDPLVLLAKRLRIATQATENVAKLIASNFVADICPRITLMIADKCVQELVWDMI
jgi:hypothetical protein